jgi:hypothetical protein
MLVYSVPFGLDMSFLSLGTRFHSVPTLHFLLMTFILDTQPDEKIMIYI